MAKAQPTAIYNESLLLSRQTVAAASHRRLSVPELEQEQELSLQCGMWCWGWAWRPSPLSPTEP